MAYNVHVRVFVVLIILLLAYLSLVPFGATVALSFQYDFSNHGVLERANLLYLNDSFADGDRISLTKMTTQSVGRVAYAQPMRLWDCRTGNVASFSTSFSFSIVGNHNSTRGDGIAFFVGPFPPILPQNSTNEYLGLYTNPNILGSPPTVAVEFDTFWNSALDPPNVTDHVGIDINSLHSINYTTEVPDLGLYGRMSANITYDADAKMMAVSLQLADGSNHRVQTSVDLIAAGLPQDAGVGFSASTGAFWESHQLLSWSFNSTDMVSDAATLADPSCNTKTTKPWVLQGVAYGEGACLLAAILYIGIDCFVRRARPLTREKPLTTVSTELSRQELLETTNNNLHDNTTGPPISLPVPREFTYQELCAATNNFSSDRKVGEGEFGEVYGGDLPGRRTRLPVAVKKLKLQWERARRDYVTEIMTLGQLHHKNLVKLVGWCDDDDSGGGEHLLLVYELVANRSVDKHLHKAERLLTWPERYKVVLGVGYAVEYLHTGGCPTPILHRDIKPSNVMLDGDFEAKLGDFGLVRQVPRQGYLSGTLMVGSTDYIDPVCISKGTATTASDMYSFGVLLLEVATGKDPAAMREEVGRPTALIDAVRDSYHSGTVLQQADQRLNGNFDQWQMERVLVVGLLCVQSDRHDRPSIREAVYLLSNRGHQLPPIVRRRV